MPRRHRTAVILAIGDELTLGQRPDTNSRWLAQRLADVGVVALRFLTLPDDRPAIARGIADAIDDADLVLTTGGLGPTADDLTRQALADAIGQPLVEDAAALESIRARFAGREMPDANRVQALRPPSARCLDNPEGTAPGLHVELDAATLFCLPGPPPEMRPMFERFVRPALRPASTVHTAAVHTVGLGESRVAEILGELMRRDRSPLVGTTASGGVVTCRVRAASDADLADAVARVRALLGDIVFGEGDDTLASAVLRELRARGQTLATVESCTGGLLGGEITGVPGSSDVYAGGWVTYTNELKRRLVGVPGPILTRHGAVSKACALAMAEGGRARSGADWCLSITGIAGPGGGSPDKPVGTVWIALAGPHDPHHPHESLHDPHDPHHDPHDPPHDPHQDTAAHRLLFQGALLPFSLLCRRPTHHSHARRFHFQGARDAVRAWSVTSALAVLRQALLGRRAPLLREVGSNETA